MWLAYKILVLITLSKQQRHKQELGPNFLQNLTADETSRHRVTCTNPEGGGGWGQGVLTPPVKSKKNIGFLSNNGPDPLKNHKASKSAFNVMPSSARQRNAI